MYIYLLQEIPVFFIEAKAMAGAVRSAVECESSQSFPGKATLGDLEILLGTPETVASVYKEAIAKSEKRLVCLELNFI